MRALAGIAALALLLVAGAFVFAPTEAAEFDQAQIEAEVLEVMETFIDGFRELDIEKVIQTAHTDALMFPYGGRVLDFAAYRDALDSWADGKTSWKGGWTETHRQCSVV